MKAVLKASTLMLALSITGPAYAMHQSAPAKPAKAKPEVTCNGEKGEVSIKVEGRGLKASDAAHLAYKCLSTKNATVKQAIEAAIKQAQNEYDTVTQCGKPGKAQTLQIGDWRSERPSPSMSEDEQTVFGTIYSEATIIVHQPITCSGIGSGLYSGTASAVNFKLEMVESFKFIMDANDTPSTQVWDVTFMGLVNL